MDDMQIEEIFKELAGITKAEYESAISDRYKDYTNPINIADHVIYRDEIIEKKDEFISLLDGLTNRNGSHWKSQRESMERALQDYLMIYATRSYEGVEKKIFQNSDLDIAIQMLLEDVNGLNPKKRVICFLKNMYTEASEITLGEDSTIVLKRAPRWDVRLFQLAFQGMGFEMSSEISQVDRFWRVHPAWTIQISLDNSQMSNDEANHVVERVIACIRLLFDCTIGTDGIYLLDCGNTSTRWNFSTHIWSSLRYPEVPFKRSIDTDSDLLFSYWDPLPFIIGRNEAALLKEFWPVVNETLNPTRVKRAHQAFKRAYLRYALSLNEEYIEDMEIDLFIAIETLLGSNYEQIAKRLSILLGDGDTIAPIEEDVHDILDKIRSLVIHGRVPDSQDRELLTKLRLIVRIMIRHCAYTINSIEASREHPEQRLRISDIWRELEKVTEGTQRTMKMSEEHRAWVETLPSLGFEEIRKLYKIEKGDSS